MNIAVITGAATFVVEKKQQAEIFLCSQAKRPVTMTLVLVHNKKEFRNLIIKNVCGEKKENSKS